MAAVKPASTMLLTVPTVPAPVDLKITASPTPGGVPPPTVVQLAEADQFWLVPLAPDQVVVPAALDDCVPPAAISVAMAVTIERRPMMIPSLIFINLDLEGFEYNHPVKRLLF